MTYLNRRWVALAVGVVCAAAMAVATAPASAGNFCNNVLLQAGGTNSLSNTCIHGASHRIFSVEAHANSNAMSCAGGTYHDYTPDWYGNSPVCCPNDGCSVTWTPNGAQVYPALHNHSTHQGRFQGYFVIY